MKARYYTFGLVGALSAAALGPMWAAQKGAPQRTETPYRAVSSGGMQKATVVVDNGFSPRSIWVKPGQPVQLTFVREEESGCGGTLLLPSLGLKRTLEPGEKTTVTFTPKKEGAVSFTCGMKMYRGQVVVSEDEKEASRLSRVSGKGGSGCGGGCCN